MANVELTEENKAELFRIVTRVKESKAYKNYLAGVRLNARRAESMAGEGDAFAKIGRALHDKNFPAYLNATKRGQEKVESALQAEMKQKRLQGLLKNEEFKEALYNEMYVAEGSMDGYLRQSVQQDHSAAEILPEQNPNKQQEEKMSDTENQTPTEELFDWPEGISEEFLKSAEVAALGVSADGKLTKDQLETVTKALKAWQEKSAESEEEVPPMDASENQDEADKQKESEKRENDGAEKEAAANDDIVAPAAAEENDALVIEEAEADDRVQEQEKENAAAEENGALVIEEADAKAREQENVKEEPEKEEPEKEEPEKEEPEKEEPEEEKEEEIRDEDWVVKYNEALTKWGKEHDNEWTRDNEPDENGERPVGLKGQFQDGTEVHYTAQDKVSLRAPEGKQIAAEHFAAVIALAKENGQAIKLGEHVSDEFKAALLEAAAKNGVTVQGLSEEDQKIYDEFKPHEEEQKQEPEQEKKEPEQEKTEPEYKLNANATRVRLEKYSSAGFSDDPYQRRAVNASNDEFAQEISKMEENLAKGWYKATGEDKAKAEILLKKYAYAEAHKDAEGMETCETALKRYGLDSIRRNEKGNYEVAGKPYAERTDAEKEKINEALNKALPAKEQGAENTSQQELSPAVQKALAERQGQTLQ